MLVKGIPVSSVLYNIATNYNHWRLKYISSDDSFYSYYVRAVRKVSVMYNTTKQTLLLSGDVELNPGPLTDNTINGVCFYNNSDFTLRYRMLRHGLIPLDVGGEGDCFFRSVSHQLYGNSNSHLTIRSLGVRYLKDNPERFIESIVGMSWSRYLTNISLQGTWANHIIAPAGISPLGEIPRRHPSSSHVYQGQYLQFKYAVSILEKILICSNRGREESVGNDDVSIVCARKYEMVRMT